MLAAAASYPDRTALMHTRNGEFESITYASLASAVRAAGVRLRAFGIGKGDVVGIASPNRPQWVVADLAILSLGGIVVPVYPTLPVGQLKYIVNDSRMRMLMVGHSRLLAAVEGIRSEVPDLEEVILLDDWGIRFPSGGVPDPSAGDDAGREDTAGVDLGPDDLATIVYTSGTTGEPKGVMLTHGNIVSNARALIERYEIGPDDSTVSYLPLAHMFERTCGHYVFLFSGGAVAYAEALTTVVRDVAAVRPTILIAVPRVLERAYETALSKVESGPWFKRGLVHRAFTLLNERANRRYQGRLVPPWLWLRCRMYDAIIASQFRKVGGGRLRVIVSGGAPLDRRIGKIMHVMGFGVVEGYGMTEASPVIASGFVLRHRLGTVGKPLRGVEVMISGDGEILVRGPNVMKGYLGKEEATAAVLGDDGWLHSGDLGEFDEDGNLVVTGRIKDLIVTSYGKNVAPVPIEERLARSRYVTQAVVFGDNRKSLVALLVPARADIERFAAEQGVAADSYEALLTHHAVRELLGEEVKRLNAECASYERITGFIVASEPFTPENGMLTQTLKLRRRVIAEAYADRIDSLYDDLGSRHAH
ncbi:MAG: long-chain fatty acid--CoA ligase [Candidatus Eisenbacteria bacterium]